MRRATLGDAPEIRALREQVFADSSTENVLEENESSRSSGTDEIWLLEAGRLVGYIHSTHRHIPCTLAAGHVLPRPTNEAPVTLGYPTIHQVTLRALVVAPDCRGRGFGRTLMDGFMQRCHEPTWVGARVPIETGDDAAVLLAFYLHRGFEIIQETPQHWYLGCWVRRGKVWARASRIPVLRVAGCLVVNASGTAALLMDDYRLPTLEEPGPTKEIDAFLASPALRHWYRSKGLLCIPGVDGADPGANPSEASTTYASTVDVHMAVMQVGDPQSLSPMEGVVWVSLEETARLVLGTIYEQTFAYAVADLAAGYLFRDSAVPRGDDSTSLAGPPGVFSDLGQVSLEIAS